MSIRNPSRRPGEGDQSWVLRRMLGAWLSGKGLRLSADELRMVIEMDDAMRTLMLNIQDEEDGGDGDTR